jgi:hypothetical protein
MHYKNGREAKEGDSVVGKNWCGTAVCGTLSDLNKSTDSCNGQLNRALGPQLYVTVGELYHVEDALAAVEALQPLADTAPQPPLPAATPAKS